MNHKQPSAFIIAIILFCTGCDATLATPTVTLPEFVTATLHVAAAPPSTLTPLPPTTAPTISPIAGTTTTEVNVRVDTSTASQSLGTIPAFSVVQIIGKDASGNWFRIIFSNDSGWVRADYVQVTDAAAEIPILSAGTGSGSAGRGVVLRGVNVRSGPGQDFESLGLLNQNDVVSIIGKDPSSTWMKIDYPVSANGTGWVAAEFLQIDNIDAIPSLEQTAEVSATNTADTTVVSSPRPQQSLLTDGDSADAPLASFTLSAVSARAVQFQGEVSSAPGGDGEDWIRFSSPDEDVVIQVLCESGGIKVELFEIVTSSDLKLDCGGIQIVQTDQGQSYLLRISSITADERVSIKYELKIKIRN